MHAELTKITIFKNLSKCFYFSLNLSTFQPTYFILPTNPNSDRKFKLSFGLVKIVHVGSGSDNECHLKALKYLKVLKY